MSAQDSCWKRKEQADEAQYAREKEQAQLAALAEKLKKNEEAMGPSPQEEFEGGYGGQETLEDRYATTYGGH